MLFDNFTELFNESRELIGDFESKRVVLRKRLKEENKSVSEIAKSERDLYWETMGERFEEIKNEITQQHGDKVFFEFCQKLEWGTHNGEYEWVEGIGAIDKSIATLISTLNAKEFKTRYCCSGIHSEHKKIPENGIKKGYIMFLNLNEEKLEIIKKLTFKNRFFVMLRESKEVEGLKILKSEEVLIIYNEEDTDRKKINKWNKFLNDVENL